MRCLSCDVHHPARDHLVSLEVGQALLTLVLAQKMLGHKTLASTIEHYVHFDGAVSAAARFVKAIVCDGDLTEWDADLDVLQDALIEAAWTQNGGSHGV